MERLSPAFLTRTSLILLVGALTLGFGPGQASAQDVQESAEEQETIKPDLKDYIGSYDGRVFTIEGGSLTFSNDHMPVPVSMESVGEDQFEVIIPAGAIVRGPAGGGIPTFLFNRNDEGIVVSLSLVDPDGAVLSTYDRDAD